MSDFKHLADRGLLNKVKIRHINIVLDNLMGFPCLRFWLKLTKFLPVFLLPLAQPPANERLPNGFTLTRLFQTAHLLASAQLAAKRPKQVGCQKKQCLKPFEIAVFHMRKVSGFCDG